MASEEPVVPTYDDNQTYAKYLKKKCLEEGHHGHDHGGCADCSGGCDDKDCSCCPPGLIAVYDDKGVHQGCLTPNDAEAFHTNTFTCQDGYVKLYKEGSPSQFLGCVSETEFVALYAAVNA